MIIMPTVANSTSTGILEPRDALRTVPVERQDQRQRAAEQDQLFVEGGERIG